MDLSPHEDLHTGLSVWQSTTLPPLAYAPLRSDVSTDVLVVGAGISGALAADSLSDAGLRVVVADRRRPVSGATAASTALIQYDLDLPLVRLTERIGTEHANRVWQRARLAMDALYQRTRHLGIDAGFERRDSLYLDGSILDLRGLARETDARRHAGFEVTLLNPPDVERRFGIKGRAAILSYDQLAADPRRLATDFLRAASSRGARIASPADITAVSAHTSGVTAETAGGPTVQARHVVFATGYEVPAGRSPHRSRHGIHLGHRHQAAAAESVAGPLHDLGSVRSLFVRTQRPRRRGDLRRRGRTVFGSGGARCPDGREDTPTRSAAGGLVPATGSACRVRVVRHIRAVRAGLTVYWRRARDA